MHQSDQSPFHVAIPQTPLRAVELSERMATNPTIGNSVNASGELPEIGESHRDMEPIQHVLGFGSNLLLNGSQTSISIRKNSDRSGFGDSALPRGKTDRFHRLGTSVAHEGKTGGVPFAIEHFACHDLEVSFRPLVSISDVPAIQADYQFFSGLVRRRGSEHFRRFLQPSAHLHRPVTHRAPVVWEDKGKSSPRKSATFPNGNNAAIFAVRYRNSGVLGFLFVKSVEKLRACDPEHEHPLSRRIRMPTFPYTERSVAR
jgi:hypothetical protein